MAFNVGINVIEVDGQATPTIVAAPISVAGFLVRSQRGIPNRPVHVSSFSDFVNAFGSYLKFPNNTYAYGAYALRGFFDNGGTEAYVVRIVGNGAVTSSATLHDRSVSPGADTLVVETGMLGSKDPGAWGSTLQLTVRDHPRGVSLVPAQIIGTRAEPFALTDGEQLQVTVNNSATPITLTFRSGSFNTIGAASASEVAAAINNQTSDIRAGVTPSRQIILTSSSITSLAAKQSHLLIAAGAAMNTLGFAANSDGAVAAGASLMALQSVGGFVRGSAIRFEAQGHTIAPSPITPPVASGSSINVSADGGPVVAITFNTSDFSVSGVTPDAVVAAINRQAKGFTAGLTIDNRLVLTSNSYGPTSTITVTAGTTDATTALGLAGNTPIVGAREYRELDTVAGSYKFVTWLGAALPAFPTNFTRVQSVEFDLIVSQNGNEVERFESVSMQRTLDYNVATMVNNQNSGSRYITVSLPATINTSGVGLNVPAEVTLIALSQRQGNDGNDPLPTDYIGDPTLRSGLFAFDPLGIQLLACPESTSSAVTTSAITYCENRGDAMFVGTPPYGYDLNGMKTYANTFRGRKVYGALYGPWIQVVNPLDTSGKNPLLWIPPVGHVLGIYARIGDERGVWKAPAGDQAGLNNALGVAFDMTDVDHTDLVKNGGVNGIRAIPGLGIIVDASRTLSTDTRWLFVNVRRLFNFVKSSVRDGLRFVAQEPNSEELRRTVVFNVLTPFLLGLWRQGAFGSDTPDKVFTVKCDAENNPPNLVNQGIFTVELYFYPVKPAETIVIVVGQQESSVTAAEA